MFTGCIGKDEFGLLMAKKANEDGVETHYAISDTEPTGTCAVCLTDRGKNRSLCAFLGASQKFTDQHLIDNWDALVKSTDIIYMSGFLIAVSPASYQLLGEHIAKSNDEKRRFCLNLSAPYVSAIFGHELIKVMKYVDIVFGNDDEAKAYAKFRQWDSDDVGETAKKIALDEKVRKDVRRLVIITQGERPIIVAQHLEDNRVSLRSFPCRTIPKEEIVDTNGAGDSFAGGFLSQYMQGAKLDDCIEVGSYAAAEVIKISGIAVPRFDNIPRSQ